VLESGVIERVGGERPFAVDVRVIAATNKDLREAVRSSHFREDLWFRLNVLPIHIPPLRDRMEDVVPLVRHFAARSATRLGRSVKFDAGALPLMISYMWPGNVRELANIVERLAILANSETVTADDVARVLPQDGSRPPAMPVPGETPWRDIALTATLDQYERELIARALSVSRGNVAEAARRLLTDRANLYRRMRRLGIEPPRTMI
jgi:two-component system nitrogen regulation response regulator NtrX